MGTRWSRGRRVATGIVAGVAAVVLAGVGTVAVLNRPLSRAEADASIEERLQRVVDEQEGVSSALLTVHAGGTGATHQYAVGTTSEGSAEAARTDSPYHSASVGKTMLAAVYGQLVDEGRVRLDDPVATWLDAGTLDGLFVVDGTDHAAAVTLEQLLSHTSGAGDYFEGPVTSGATMIETITADPDLYLTPHDLLDFTRERQRPVGVPGETFAYSDTGYVLLGLALEAIEGKPYDRILHDRLFAPLGMADTSVMTTYGDPDATLAIDVHGVDLRGRAALSVDWAGGGVVTTMDDLLRFLKALVGGDLVSAGTYARLTDFAHEYDTGIRYGMGMMQFRFGELSPMLFSMSDVHGAVGATGTFALYDPSGDTYYVANFGSLDFAEGALEELVQIRLIVDRVQD